MITETEIKGFIDDCSNIGAKIKVRDIAFFILKSYMLEEIAYKCIFYDSNESLNEYLSKSSISILDDYFSEKILPILKQEEQESSGITYSENKIEMENLIRSLTSSINNNDYEDEKSKITAQKTVADLRIKLSEKFNVSESSRNQIVKVEQKYNSICPYCHHEISIKKV